MVPFADREDAGRAVAAALRGCLAAGERAVVLALPRGGVPVAACVAGALHAPLDVVVVRKLGVPGHEELAFGALATGGVRVLNEAVLAATGLDEEVVAAVTAREQAELARRERRYRGDRPPAAVAGATAVIVDDGLATGATMCAAVQAVRARGAARIVAAAPIGSPEACERVAAIADAAVCLHRPSTFRAVGAWYGDFSEVGDAAVAALLAAHPSSGPDAASSRGAGPPRPRG